MLSENGLIRASLGALMLMSTTPDLKLREGDPAPDFSGDFSGGGRLSLAEFRGKTVVLYFYPKDNTPGCNKEACGFRDAYDDITERGAVVIGVSADSVKSHDKFTGKFQLPFPLLADEDRKICDAYGVWGEKSFMGMRFMGIHRVTFLIGPDGRIRRIWPKVKAAQHAAEVVAALEGV
jgi:peroxiredoxin Q/BCP